MAFPTIPTVAAGRVLSTNQADASGTRTFPDLSSLTKNSGDLLIAIIVGYQSAGSSGAVFSSWGGGFTELPAGGDQMTTSGSTMCIGLAYKISTGSETGTFTVTQASPTGHATMYLLSIPGAHPSTAPEAGTIANGTAAAADPGSFDPAGWGAEDTLWIALAASGMTSGTGSWTGTGTTAPANYGSRDDSNTTDNSTVGQTEAAVAFRQLNAASEDIGTAGVDTSNARNSALVIAVRPSNLQTLAPALLDQTASPTAPTVTTLATVAPSLLDRTAVATAPVVTSVATVASAVLDQSAAAIAPAVTSVATVIPALLDQAAVAIEPVVSQPAAGQDVQPALLNQSAVATQPTVSVGAVTVSLATLDQTAVPTEPSVQVGAVNVAPALLDQTAVAAAPAVSTTVSIPMGLLDASAMLFEPVVSFAGPGITQDVSPALLDASAVTFEPVLTAVAVLQMEVIDATASLSAPDVFLQQTIAMELLDQTASAIEPVVSWLQLLELDLIDQAAQAIIPTLAVPSSLSAITHGPSGFRGRPRDRGERVGDY